MLCNTRAGGNSQRYIRCVPLAVGGLRRVGYSRKLREFPSEGFSISKPFRSFTALESPLSRSAAMPVRSRLSRRYEVIGASQKASPFVVVGHGRLLMQGSLPRSAQRFGRFRLLQEVAIAHSSAGPPSPRLLVLSHDLGATLGISNDTHSRRTALPGSILLALPTYRNVVGDVPHGLLSFRSI